MGKIMQNLLVKGDNEKKIDTKVLRNKYLEKLKTKKEKDKTKVEIGKGASNVLEGSGGVASKPTDKNRRKTLKNVERLKKIAKRGKNKEARLNRRADRIAARKGFEGAGEFNEDGTPNSEGLMKARGKARELMAERKQKRKKFLRDFGSQLVKGVNTGPDVQSRRDFNIMEALSRFKENKKSDDTTTKDKQENEIIATDTENNKEVLSAGTGGDNSNLLYGGKGMYGLTDPDRKSFGVNLNTEYWKKLGGR